MKSILISDLFSFTEWYHYALLLLWLVILLAGLKYFHLLESLFKPKDELYKGNKYGANFLFVSFSLGLAMFLVMVLRPGQPDPQNLWFWNYAKYGFYALFVIILVLNAIVTIKNYKPESQVLRIALMAVLMIIYFYSGMLGGLMVISVFALVVIIYALIKLKKILTIR